jgi:hypothetical protein
MEAERGDSGSHQRRRVSIDGEQFVRTLSLSAVIYEQLARR